MFLEFEMFCEMNLSIISFLLLGAKLPYQSFSIYYYLTKLEKHLHQPVGRETCMKKVVKKYKEARVEKADATESPGSLEDVTTLKYLSHRL